MGAAAFEDVLLAVVEDALPAVVEDALLAVVDGAAIAVLLGTVVFPEPPQNVIKRLTYKFKVQAIFPLKKHRATNVVFLAGHLDLIVIWFEKSGVACS